MSLKDKLNAARHLKAIITSWPDDSKKVYTSFRAHQIRLLETEQPSALPPVSVSNLRSEAATNLLNDYYRKQFKPRDSLLVPDGNPYYYERIVKEASNWNKQKPGLANSFKEAVRRWWNK